MENTEAAHGLSSDSWLGQSQSPWERGGSPFINSYIMTSLTADQSVTETDPGNPGTLKRGENVTTNP